MNPECKFNGLFHYFHYQYSMRHNSSLICMVGTTYVYIDKNFLRFMGTFFIIIFTA